MDRALPPSSLPQHLASSYLQTLHRSTNLHHEPQRFLGQSVHRYLHPVYMKVNFYRFHPLPIGLSIAGDVFELDDEGKAIVIAPSTDDEILQLAAEACPVRAIFLYNTDDLSQTFPPQKEISQEFDEIKEKLELAQFANNKLPEDLE